MNLEQVEVQIADLLTKAKKMQIRAQQLQRQGLMVARQGEVIVRERLSNYLDGGLNLLGQGIIKGRKLKETLTAETHRKAASLRKDESMIENENVAENDVADTDGIKSELVKKASNLKEQSKSMPDKGTIKKNKIKPKKSMSHFSNASRAR